MQSILSSIEGFLGYLVGFAIITVLSLYEKVAQVGTKQRTNRI